MVLEVDLPFSLCIHGDCLCFIAQLATKRERQTRNDPHRILTRLEEQENTNLRIYLLKVVRLDPVVAAVMPAPHDITPPLRQAARPQAWKWDICT